MLNVAGAGLHVGSCRRNASSLPRLEARILFPYYGVNYGVYCLCLGYGVRCERGALGFSPAEYFARLQESPDASDQWFNEIQYEKNHSTE